VLLVGPVGLLLLHMLLLLYLLLLYLVLHLVERRHRRQRRSRHRYMRCLLGLELVELLLLLLLLLQRIHHPITLVPSGTITHTSTEHIVIHEYIVVNKISILVLLLELLHPVYHRFLRQWLPQLLLLSFNDPTLSTRLILTYLRWLIIESLSLASTTPSNFTHTMRDSLI
jgi:membrane-associated HD superfamily phosphohydrolase